MTITSNHSSRSMRDITEDMIIALFDQNRQSYLTELDTLRNKYFAIFKKEIQALTAYR